MSNKIWRGFASDNYAGIHPEVLQKISDVNGGHQAAYGDDDVTAELGEVIKKHFGKSAQIFPVFNGTGANVVSLQAMCRAWEAVICAAGAHINVDEGGAPEKVAGLKLHIIETTDGKLTPELIETQAWGRGNRGVSRGLPGTGRRAGPDRGSGLSGITRRGHHGPEGGPIHYRRFRVALGRGSRGI